MPFRSNVQWEIVHTSIPPARINAVLDIMKAFRIVTSHETPCTVCYNNLDRHKMRYQLVACTSEPCGLLVPDEYCVWRGKIEQCQKTKHLSVSQHGHHLEQEHPPPQNRLSREMKQFVQEITEQGMKPARIRIQMVNTFCLSSVELPTLRQVYMLVEEAMKILFCLA
ncbi:TPA: hypothetical protein N0F65_000663 [Lagenidium giganteum]|uniref:Uncharacterized protein n=1 Tax=Lagenidium giganteum TaxID=4803 RepID=A0AAV2YQ49_9STRA|nr:TPA: hypothetical protein N0F65_000663 [Lagenidium giganteum]